MGQIGATQLADFVQQPGRMTELKPSDEREAERLARLRATGLLDASVDPAFDRLARLAAKMLNAPVSTVTLVDADRQFYMSCVGMPEPLATVRQTPLEYSFCRHTVELGEPLVIPDVRGHRLVGDNPAIAEFGVTAYAGIPLLTSDGHALGTLCVMDFQVRHWTLDEVASLADLAAAVSTEIELRMDIAERVRVERELQHTIHLRDEVLSIVSHDLRNPVHTVVLSSDLALEQLAEGAEPAAVRKQIEIIRRSSWQMDRLIRDLLDVASIASGRLSLERQSVSILALLDNACEALRPLVEEKRLHFRCEAPQATAVVEADPDRILQLLSNLVGNAVKFTEAGGSIVLRLENTEADRGRVRFAVVDTGAGIESQHLPHLFDRFWQARAGGRHGAGLGLAISRGIVEAHGGEIGVQSEPGKGTTIFFTLPVLNVATESASGT